VFTKLNIKNCLKRKRIPWNNYLDFKHIFGMKYIIKVKFAQEILDYHFVGARLAIVYIISRKNRAIEYKSETQTQ